MHLSNKKIQNIEISYPPIDEQKRIVKYLDEVFKKIAIAKKATERKQADLDELQKSLLKRVFNKEL